MALLFAIVALAIVTVICATATKTTVLMHSHANQRLDRHQAELLALAGLDKLRQAAASGKLPEPASWTVNLRPGETAVVETLSETTGTSILLTSRATLTSRDGTLITSSRQLSLPAAAAERL